MPALINHLRFALLTCLAVGVTASASPVRADPPNWKGGGPGTTVAGAYHIDGNGDLHRTDVDAFSGKSSHLGRFTGVGSHDLNFTTFAFAGEATWTASNGDTLSVIYEGQLFPPSGPPNGGPYPYGDYPFEFVATLHAVGGTGRFAGAAGEAVMTGAFSGDGTPPFPPVPVPGVFFFNFQGTLHPNGN